MNLVDTSDTKLKAVIVNNHRGYPRPRGVCDICNECIILCWGEVMKPYWRHDSGHGGGHEPSGESAEHKLAKKMIAEYLNSGGKVDVITLCQQCGRKSLSHVPSGLKFLEEVKHESSEGGKCCFDVAGLASDNKIAIGIEIWHSHKTDNMSTRKDVKWLEFRSLDVINLLDVESRPEKIELQNYNNATCGCPSMRQLAIKLEYLYNYNPYACEARRLVDIALKGKYLSPEERWNTTGNYSLESEWKEFLMRRKCIRCERDYNSVKGKPMCVQCYKIAANSDIGETWIDAQNLKMLLRSKMRFIDNIPASNGFICSVCNYDFMSGSIDNEANSKYWEPGSNYVKSNTWWFGTKKAICSICLQREFDRRGIAID